MGKDFPGQSKVLEKLNSDEPIGQEGQISLTNSSPKFSDNLEETLVTEVVTEQAEQKTKIPQ